MKRRFRRTLWQWIAAVFFTILAIYALAIDEPWFGAAWAWLSGAQWVLAAWIRSERRALGGGE